MGWTEFLHKQILRNRCLLERLLAGKSVCWSAYLLEIRSGAEDRTTNRCRASRVALAEWRAGNSFVLQPVSVFGSGSPVRMPVMGKLGTSRLSARTCSAPPARGDTERRVASGGAA